MRVITQIPNNDLKAAQHLAELAERAGFDSIVTAENALQIGADDDVGRLAKCVEAIKAIPAPFAGFQKLAEPINTDREIDKDR